MTSSEVPASVVWPSNQPATVRRQLLRWYHTAGRSQLPWLAHADQNGWVNDYHIAVSEVMMQQTTVAVGLKRFPQWMEQFPTWESLANAPSEDVMKAWEGLGYYARARSLHKMAQTVVREYGGRLPQERTARLKLPGVGPTTASAMGAFVFAQREPIWDANVNRVWKRWWGDTYPQLPAKQQKQWEWEMARQAMPNTSEKIRQWTQAIMDFGATVCTPRAPRCSECPWQKSCRSYANGTQAQAHSAKPVLVRQQLWKNWVWCTQNGKVAVIRPTEKGVWAGLWQLPEAQMFPLPAEGVPLNVKGLHKLSHRDVFWSIARVSVALSHEVVWLTAEEWDRLALPQPLRKWWDGLDDDSRKQWMS